MKEVNTSLLNNGTCDNDDMEHIHVDENTQLSRDGLKILMGLALANTNAHIVSAPMATWLVRIDSRFGIMNDFQYVLVNTFATRVI